MKIFAIKYLKNGIQDTLITCFLSNDYTEAELYFQGFIFGEKNSHNYNLYQIGEINKNLEIKENKIFITTGFQKDEKEKEKLSKNYQLKWLKEEIKEQKLKEQKDIIKYLFKGEEI